MLVIPVLDLRHGRIVHARRGERSTYRPVCSALCPSSKPADVLSAFLELYPFSVFYLADLDAITDGPPQPAVVDAMRARCPAIELWVDAGISTAGDWEAWRGLEGVRPVIGSETLANMDDACAVLQALSTSRPVLSLDFAHGALLGPTRLGSEEARWPDRIIVMNLDRVGSGEGPDTAGLAQLRRRAPEREFFAAGGIRHMADLEAVHGAGASGALVATALHDRSITRSDLERLRE